MRVGLIRVISLSDPQARDAHGRWLSAHYPGMKVVCRAIPGFPKGIYNAELERAAVPVILKLAEELHSHVDALAISCAADPGVAELRARFPTIPVVGAGSALGYVCRCFGRKVGFLTIAPALPGAVADAVAGLEYRFAWLPGVHDTTDLPRAKDAIVEKGEELLALGCGVLGLACTGFSTLRIAPRLQQLLGVPVIDPVLAIGAILSLIQATRNPQEGR